MAATMKENAREAIMLAAREAAMARGYGGINFRDLAETVGIKAASINYYFANKALLGEAVARRYWKIYLVILRRSPPMPPRRWMPYGSIPEFFARC